MYIPRFERNLSSKRFFRSARLFPSFSPFSRRAQRDGKNGKQTKTHRPAAIPRFLEPFHTRSSQSTGTCRDPLLRPTSRKYVPWKPPLCERPFSMAGRPSASTTPPAEIHLRCTSEKQFREKGA